MDSTICTEAKCQLPLTEYTQTGPVEFIHRFHQETRRFLMNSLNAPSCLSQKSIYSEFHWIFASQEYTWDNKGEQQESKLVSHVGNKAGPEEPRGGNSCLEAQSPPGIIVPQHHQFWQKLPQDKVLPFVGAPASSGIILLLFLWEKWWTKLKHFMEQLSGTVSFSLPFPRHQQPHFQCPPFPLTLFFCFLVSITTHQFTIHLVCSLTVFPIPYGTFASPLAVAPLCSYLASSEPFLRSFLLC